MLRITLLYMDSEKVRLKLDGRLAGLNVASLKHELLNYMDGKHKTVILDFSGVSYIDTSGRSMLESINDGKLKIVNCSMFIEKFLENLISATRENQDEK